MSGSSSSFFQNERQRCSHPELQPGGPKSPTPEIFITIRLRGKQHLLQKCLGAGEGACVCLGKYTLKRKEEKGQGRGEREIYEVREAEGERREKKGGMERDMGGHKKKDWQGCGVEKERIQIRCLSFFAVSQPQSQYLEARVI